MKNRRDSIYYYFCHSEAQSAQNDEWGRIMESVAKEGREILVIPEKELFEGKTEYHCYKELVQKRAEEGAKKC